MKTVDLFLGKSDFEYTPDGYLKGILPVPFIRKGEVCREFYLDEMNGSIEQHLKRIGNNPIDIQTTIITGCLKWLDGYKADKDVKSDKDPDAITQDVVNSMCSINRDYLFLLCQYLVNGRMQDIEFKCDDSCGFMEETEEDLKDVNIPYYEDVEETIIEGFFKKPQLFRGTLVKSFKHSFINGKALRDLNNNIKSDNIDFKASIIAGALISIDDFTDIKIEEIIDSKTSFRNTIFESVTGKNYEKLIGIDATFEKKCPQCGKVHKISKIQPFF